MALFRFNCDSCKKNPIAKFGSTAAQALIKYGTRCGKCGGKMVRIVKPPTTNVVEKLDSPYMVRPIERPADAERLFKERSKRDPLKDK
jgi:hypothetical protein